MELLIGFSQDEVRDYSDGFKDAYKPQKEILNLDSVHELDPQRIEVLNRVEQILKEAEFPDKNLHLKAQLEKELESQNEKRDTYLMCKIWKKIIDLP